ncbi:IS110 family transposase [Primorskyibacter sp. 2E233]|uniref:IS110 family transposase n=1 Tax=Primorskyibacter sp. 2E233 TaxID=3413431 RepID=UPI003BF247AD
MKTRHPVIIGIDTHKATHVAVAIDTQGTRLAAVSIPTSPKGYLELERWSRSLGHVLAFGIEGTGSYGAGLSRSLLAQGHNVIEVTRPNRQLRYTQGKTDSLDAEGAARSVLSGQATAQPKTQTGSSEMIRHLKITRDTAVKSRSQAMVTLKTLIINAPADLRDVLDQIKGKVALIRHIAAFRTGEINTPLASAKTAMRALARPLAPVRPVAENRIPSLAPFLGPSQGRTSRVRESIAFPAVTTTSSGSVPKGVPSCFDSQPMIDRLRGLSTTVRWVGTLASRCYCENILPVRQ